MTDAAHRPFRARLAATLRAIAPLFDVPGVVVVGSEVPNLLEPGAAATLVVSQDIDIAVPVGARDAFKAALQRVPGFRPSRDEPSVWLPDDPDHIEVNFLGLDTSIAPDPAETYLLDDPELPLMVFGLLSLVTGAIPVTVDGVSIRVAPIPALLLEKLATDRTAEKGDRDLLVALGLLTLAEEEELAEVFELYRTLGAEVCHAVRAGATMLSLLGPRPGMPDPRLQRQRVARFLARLDDMERGS